MELRVWVDGIQRVVCGVKLTTTCQEIVFALAHATQQAGRFTMIERWRNNERPLSPNEQPLVTLQRWGDHMNEVEFILRKTSTDAPQPQQQPSQQQQQQLQPQQQVSQAPQQQANQPIIYQPPLVPAKPRLMNPNTNLPMPQKSLQTINNAHMNFYHPNHSPVNVYSGAGFRPRHPPPYLDYLEAYRNSFPHPAMSNTPSSIAHPSQQQQPVQGSMFPARATYDQQSLDNVRQNGTDSANSPAAASNKYCYQAATNGQQLRTSFMNDLNSTSSLQNLNSINPKLNDCAGFIVNRGSAVNIKLPSNSHNQLSSQNFSSTEESSCLDNSNHSNASSVSQLGHDMLRVIEEQKKVLIDQKNELDRLDNDQEYWKAKQESEQAELINRIETEIKQLEDLWKDNQVQIKKLQNQDFEKELEVLKQEQTKFDHEIETQKNKLAEFEEDLIECRNKIKQLEIELANREEVPQSPC